MARRAEEHLAEGLVEGERLQPERSPDRLRCGSFLLGRRFERVRRAPLDGTTACWSDSCAPLTLIPVMTW